MITLCRKLARTVEEYWLEASGGSQRYVRQSQLIKTLCSKEIPDLPIEGSLVMSHRDVMLLTWPRGEMPESLVHLYQ